MQKNTQVTGREALRTHLQGAAVQEEVVGIVRPAEEQHCKTESSSDGAGTHLVRQFSVSPSL